MKNLILFLGVLFLLISCSKNNSNDIDTPPEQQNQNIQENVVAILESNSKITSTETELSNGIYSIEFSDKLPEIVKNDIIVGDAGEGFLRKVERISSNGNTLTLQTVQANMEDVFKTATIEFTTDISESSKITNGKSHKLKVNYLAKGVELSANGLEYSFSNTTLYDQDGLTFKITNGTAKFDPNFSFKADYSLLSGLEYLNFDTNNATLNIDCDLFLNLSGNVSLPKFSKTLADFDKRIVFLVAGLPVVVVVNTQLIAQLDAGIDANVTVTSGFTNNYTLTSGVKYENDSWTGNFDLNANLTPKPIRFNGQVNITQNLTITPKVSVKFYSVIGPYCEPKMTEDLTFNIASPSLDWDSNLKVGVDLTTGIHVTIFGHSFDPFLRKDSFEEIIWNAPQGLEIISGNNQAGTLGQQLTEPLKVKVIDNLGNPLPNVNVYFTVILGNGTVDNTSVMTDENGFAEIRWTFGNDESVHSEKVWATVHNTDGSNKYVEVFIAQYIPLDTHKNLEIISGNTQTGIRGQQLAEPLKVKVTDNLGNPLININIDFNVTLGSGTVDNTSVLTDENGFAEVRWTLGNAMGLQKVEATVINIDGSEINSSVEFTANSTCKIMTIRVTNLLQDCPDCDPLNDTPSISKFIGGSFNTILGFGSSLDYEVCEDSPYLYLWTCETDCIWQAYSVPVQVGGTIDTDENNPNHRKLRFTRID